MLPFVVDFTIAIQGIQINLILDLSVRKCTLCYLNMFKSVIRTCKVGHNSFFEQN